MKKQNYLLIAVCAALPWQTPACAQEHHHHHGGFGGGSGFGGFGGGSSGGFVPSIVADSLLVPSLTKPQQTKIRTLYYQHRAKAAGRMEVMSKLRNQFHHERDRNDDDDKGAKKDGKKSSKQSQIEAGMDASSENLRRTLFMSMMKEYEKFQQDILAVLNAKQHEELREIASKAGSPDYFTKRHYDKMNADGGRGGGQVHPD